jgi:Zn-dependent peptidase ImmA (M78 family)/ribosomal protein L37E
MQLSPDYRQPIIEALIVLEDSGITRFPVDLHAIGHQYRNLFEIRPYVSLMKERGYTLEECIQLLRSEDGASVLHGYGRYVIYYNERMSRRRKRFTIAHEIGHVILGHHLESGVPVLSRDTMEQRLYQRQEHEASCFARNLLCPAYHAERLLDAHGISRVANEDVWEVARRTALTENLGMRFSAQSLIEKAFDISSAAAKTRVALLQTDIDMYRAHHLDWESTKDIGQAARWYCTRCNLERFPGASHCSECGSKRFSFRVDASGFAYQDLGVNAHMQFSPCPVCGNESYSADAGYCRICGTPLTNPCTDDPAHLNHPEAKHCYACGNPTAFHGSDHHLRIKRSVETQNEGDFPMIYESQIAYDPKTNKVTMCPRCDNEQINADAAYCRICGLPLVNTCIPGYREDEFGNSYSRNTHENLPDSRFCEQCGQPTVYFKDGLLKTYAQILGLDEPGDDDNDFDPDIPF